MLDSPAYRGAQQITLLARSHPLTLEHPPTPEFTGSSVPSRTDHMSSNY